MVAMKLFFLAIILLLGSIYAAAAQFNGCPPGFCRAGTSMGNSGGGFGPSGGGGAAPVSCASTGVFDLSNVCNDVYFIGALK